MSRGISSQAATSGSRAGAMDRLLALPAPQAKRQAVGAMDDQVKKLVVATAKTVVGMDNVQRRQTGLLTTCFLVSADNQLLQAMQKGTILQNIRVAHMPSPAGVHIHEPKCRIQLQGHQFHWLGHNTR